MTQQTTHQKHVFDTPESNIDTFDEKLIETLNFADKETTTQFEIESVVIRIQFGDQHFYFDSFHTVPYLLTNQSDDVLTLDEYDGKIAKVDATTIQQYITQYFNNAFMNTFYVPILDSNGDIDDFAVFDIHDMDILYVGEDTQTGDKHTLTTNITDLKTYTHVGDPFLGEGKIDNIPREGDTMTLRTRGGNSTAKLYRADSSDVTITVGAILSPLIVSALLQLDLFAGGMFSLIVFLLLLRQQKFNSLKVESTQLDDVDVIGTNRINESMEFEIDTIDGNETIISTTVDKFRANIEDDNGNIRQDVIDFLTETGMETIEHQTFTVRMTNNYQTYSNIEHKLHVGYGVYIIPPDADV